MIPDSKVHLWGTPVIPATAPFPTILTPDVRAELDFRLAAMEKTLKSSKEGPLVCDERMAPQRLGDVMRRWLTSFLSEAQTGFLEALGREKPEISGHVEDRTVRQIREFVAGQVEEVLYRFGIHVVISDEQDELDLEPQKEWIRAEGARLGFEFESSFLDWVRDRALKKSPRVQKSKKSRAKRAPKLTERQLCALQIYERVGSYAGVAIELGIKPESARELVNKARVNRKALLDIANDSGRSKGSSARPKGRLPEDHRGQAIIDSQG